MAHPDRRRFIAFHNPNREQFDQAVDWSRIVTVSEAIPSLVPQLLRAMKREEEWMSRTETFLEDVKDAAAYGFGVDPGRVLLKPDLVPPPPDIRGTLGYLDTEQQNGQDIYPLHVIELRFLDYLELLTPYEQMKLRKRPHELARLRAEWLPVKIVKWLNVVVHEMYHVRQAVQSPLYNQEAEDATRLLDLGYERRYDFSLSERSANAIGTRGVVEVYNHLISKGFQMSKDLKEAFSKHIEDHIEEMETLSNTAKRHKHSVWMSDVFRPKRRRSWPFVWLRG